MAPRPTKRAAVVTFLGELLKSTRKAHGHRSAAAALDRLKTYPDCDTLSLRTLYRLEACHGRPEAPLLLALEAEYGIPARDWFTWSGKDQT